MFRVGSCSSSSGGEDDIWIRQAPENTPQLRTQQPPYVQKPLIPRSRIQASSSNALSSTPDPAVGHVVRRIRNASADPGSSDSSLSRRAKCRSLIPTHRNSTFDPGHDLDLHSFKCSEPTEGSGTTGRTESGLIQDGKWNKDLSPGPRVTFAGRSDMSFKEDSSGDTEEEIFLNSNFGTFSGLRNPAKDIPEFHLKDTSISESYFLWNTSGVLQVGKENSKTHSCGVWTAEKFAATGMSDLRISGTEFRNRYFSERVTKSSGAHSVAEYQSRTSGSESDPFEAENSASGTFESTKLWKKRRMRGSSEGRPLGSTLPLRGVNSLEDCSRGFERLQKNAIPEDCRSGRRRSLGSTSDQLDAEKTIRKLRRELEAAQEKVSTLTTQLSTNAHVVAAFEQSLSSMTQRLQQLTNTSHQKDSELSDLKATIEALRLQSRCHSMASTGMGSGGGSLPRQTTEQSIAFSKDSPCSGLEPSAINRHMSADSVTSLNSLSSACSRASQQSTAADLDKKKKKKNWLKSSFTKAFSRKKGKPGSASDFDADNVSLKSDTSIPNTPMLQVAHPMSTPTTPTRTVQLSALMMKSDCISGTNSSSSSRDEAVSQLKQELHEKDLKLTDIQLEALASAHQLEQLCDTMNRMKNEMTSLKADNERLQRIIVQRGLDPSLVVGGRLKARENEISSDSSRLSLTELSSSEPASGPVELTGKKEGKRVLVSVLLGSAADIGSLESKLAEVLIGALLVSKITKWESFESTIRKAFKEYMLRIEPSNNMGLNSDSILMYRVGDIIRTKSSKCPDQSPFESLKDQPETVSVTLKGTQENSVDCLAFETLIPKAIMQRYVSLLLEHRRIILCGPSGTGKTYLAQKLAEYVVSVSGKDLLAGLVATFNVDHKSSKELRQYLANIAEQCEHNAADLPSIIILDNLHHVGSLGEVFTGFLSVKHQQCPYIIGTMNQTTCSTTNLQLHHNFRWVLCANHMEPVKGFLGRFLRHKLVEEEVKTGVRNQEMNRIADWLPKVWQHLNKFLETHSSSDVTIGPRLFLACPMDVANAQVWFTDLWNYSIVPYLLEAVREGIQTYGHRAPWEDPAEWVIETYPWSKVDMPNLLHLRTEDVGYDPQGGGLVPGKSQAGSSDTENKDPLMNMLLRLQEAASYSSPPSNESDSTSLDSHESRVCGSTPKSPVPGDTKT